MTAPTPNIDEALLEWATDRERQIIEAINRLNSGAAAARELNISRQAVFSALKALKQRAALHGYAPEFDRNHGVPEPFIVKGHSTLRDREGKVVLQWEKTKIDEEKRLALVKEVIEGMSASIERVKPIAAPTFTIAHLLNLYTFTDYHFGMLAWHKEGGADWDLGKAETLLLRSFSHMIATAPAANTCVINQLGDFLHQDSIMPMTPTSGHVLDADTRFGKIVDAAVRVLRKIVDMALTKHERVVVIMAEGNHDITSSIWLRTIFSHLYENEPRVVVINNQLPYYVHQHGETMLAFHHGHMKKNEALPLLFATEHSKIWGDTNKRYCHTGHRHHLDIKEHSGMIVIQHSTLAPRDAYAARGGWTSNREATFYTYHDVYGQVASNTVIPEMFED